MDRQDRRQEPTSGIDAAALWSAPLDGSAPLRYEPVGLGEVIVVGRRGALWAFDRQGETSWVADLDGVRPVGPEGDASRPTERPEAGVHIHAGPDRVAADPVGPDATVFVGCGERLWAFAASQGSEGE
jgi:hypothetical protein